VECGRTAPEKISCANAWKRRLTAFHAQVRGVRIGSVVDAASDTETGIAPEMQVSAVPSSPAAT